MFRSKFRRAGLLLTLSYVAENGIMLIRSIAIARLLGPEDFGISATFLMITSAFALMSDLGIEKYLLQARNRDIASIQSTLQTVLFLRGILGAIMLAFLAGPIAAGFNQPELAEVYLILAIFPLIDGLRHMTPMRLQRDLNYLVSTVVQLGSLIPGTLVTIALAYWLQSYMAVLWGSLFTAALSIILSHLVSTDRYRFGVDLEVLRELLRYGWPLLLNGFVIFVGGQGDRIVIGASEGMADLAAYVAVGTLTMGISLFLSKVVGNLYLPVLSAAKGDAEDFTQQSRRCGAILLSAILVTILPLIVLGVPLVRLLYGPDYVVSAALVGWLSLQSAARIIRVWPVVLSLSMGYNQNILYSNIIRTLALVAAYWAVRSGYGMTGVAASMACGEVLATGFALLRLEGVDRRQDEAAILFGTIALGLCGTAMVIAELSAGWTAQITATLLLPALGFAATAVFSTEFRAIVLQLLQKLRPTMF